MSANATERLSRLLTMVPWLLERPGVELGEAARHFAISERQLVQDLELLFVCGTPGHLPDDLIEAEWDSGQIFVGNAEAIARPLRLSVDEAVSLLAGLRTLMEVPGLHDRDALESAMAKLSRAAGDSAARASTLSADLSGDVDEATVSTIRRALAERRRLRLTYLVPSRDEATGRDVDPVRLINVAGQWYLEGWCYRAEGARRFRLDRVVEADILDTAAVEHDLRPADDVGPALFEPSPDDAVVVVRLSESARWVSEYYPVDEVTDLADGSLLVRLRAADVAWVPRLALRLGGALSVQSPAELVQRTAEMARTALAAYGQTSPESAAH